MTDKTPAQRLNLSARREELFPLLERQVRLYTMGDSSSLPAETVEALLHSIRFCMETHVERGASAALPLEELLAAGQTDVWMLVEEGKALLQQARSADPGYGSLALRDSLAALGDFFRLYDLRFFAHDIPCMLDYPLCLPVPESLEGVRYIGEYLHRLLREHRFCSCLKRGDAVAALRVFQPEYRLLLLNLYEPLLTCALGLCLLHRDPAPLRLNVEACTRLHKLFHPWVETDAAGLLHEAVNRLCIRFQIWSPADRNYLLESANTLLPMLRAATREGYRTLFLAR